MIRCYICKGKMYDPQDIECGAHEDCQDYNKDDDREGW